MHSTLLCGAVPHPFPIRVQGGQEGGQEGRQVGGQEGGQEGRQVGGQEGGQEGRPALEAMHNVHQGQFLKTSG